MTGALLVAAMAVWAAGAAVDVVCGARAPRVRPIPYLSGAVGNGLVTAAGVRMVLGAPQTIQLGSSLGVGVTTVRLDPLAGLFLTLVGALGTAVSLCLVSWVARPNGPRARGAAWGLLLLFAAVTAILVAGDAFTFLFAWEALTVAFFVLAGYQRNRPETARASWVTLGLGKIGGAALLLGFLILAGGTHSDVFASWATGATPAVRDAAFTLLIVAFGAKVGLLPLQVWMPISYPAAPGPVRAAMAGVAVNVGFYGLWRFLGVIGAPPIWLAAVVLVVGGLTALLGITFAAVQSRLNRVIAYSSVENAGIILVGYGVALAGAATHEAGLVAVGLVAASLQVLAHAVTKTSLFASSAFIESEFGTDDLETLRGVGRRVRWSASTFGLAALTLAGLPPTIGFVSEWFILEALLQEFRVHDLVLRLAMAVGGALVALTVGVALLSFIRLVGLMLLGPGNRRGVADARADGGAAGRAGFAMLAVPCLGLAAFAPWTVRFIADGLAPVVPHATTIGALKEPWVLQPVFANFSILSPSWLFILLSVGFVVVAAFTVAASRGRVLRARRVPAWRSGTAGVAGPSSYSPFGYANVLRHVLANVLGSQRTATRSQTGTAAEDAPVDTDHAHVTVRTDITEPVEAYLYRPVRDGWLWLAKIARRLQSGRLEAYVGYMLLALLVLLSIVAAMH